MFPYTFIHCHFHSLNPTLLRVLKLQDFHVYISVFLFIFFCIYFSIYYFYVCIYCYIYICRITVSRPRLLILFDEVIKLCCSVTTFFVSSHIELKKAKCWELSTLKRPCRWPHLCISSLPADCCGEVTTDYSLLNLIKRELRVMSSHPAPSKAEEVKDEG